MTLFEIFISKGKKIDIPKKKEIDMAGKKMTKNDKRENKIKIVSWRNFPIVEDLSGGRPLSAHMIFSHLNLLYKVCFDFFAETAFFIQKTIEFGAFCI